MSTVTVEDLLVQAQDYLNECVNDRNSFKHLCDTIRVLNEYDAPSILLIAKRFSQVPELVVDEAFIPVLGVDAHDPVLLLQANIVPQCIKHFVFNSHDIKVVASAQLRTDIQIGYRDANGIHKVVEANFSSLKTFCVPVTYACAPFIRTKLAYTPNIQSYSNNITVTLNRDTSSDTNNTITIIFYSNSSRHSKAFIGEHVPYGSEITYVSHGASVCKAYEKNSIDGLIRLYYPRNNLSYLSFQEILNAQNLGENQQERYFKRLEKILVREKQFSTSFVTFSRNLSVSSNITISAEGTVNLPTGGSLVDLLTNVLAWNAYSCLNYWHSDLEEEYLSKVAIVATYLLTYYFAITNSETLLNNTVTVLKTSENALDILHLAILVMRSVAYHFLQKDMPYGSGSLSAHVYQSRRENVSDYCAWIPREITIFSKGFLVAAEHNDSSYSGEVTV